MMFVSAVNLHNIPTVWPFCVGHVADALEHADGEMEIEDVLRYVLGGNWILWTVVDDHKIIASAVTEVVEYPRLRALRVITLGGRNMKKWLPEILTVWEQHAKEIGCHRLEASGRKGWSRASAKAMNDNGFRESMRVTVKDL